VEIWKDVPDHPGYQASSLGRIRSCYDNSGKMTGAWKILKQTKNERGYMRVHLRKNKKKRFWFVHRVILLTFIGESSKQANHKNSKRDDNRIKNIEYLTPSENNLHSYRYGARQKKLGDESHFAKITEAQAKIIKYEENDYYYEIAKKYGISRGQVCNIKNGKSWPHI
jgi:hypothetical protein